MQLLPEQSERFYRIWFALLKYTNAKLRISDDFPDQPTAGSISPQVALPIRNALWADDRLREAFIAENPAGLGEQDLALVTSWKHRVAGTFFILRHLKKYTVFIGQGSPSNVYGVQGLLSPFEEVVGPALPLMVEAVLLPFEGQIAYDGLLNVFPIHFGGGIRAGLNDDYRNAKERERIITSLPAPEPAPALRLERAERGRGRGGAGAGQIYQLKITLRDSKPPIWRRVQVPADITLGRLHQVIQVAMGWSSSHLHQFRAGRDYYSDPEFQLDDARSERQVKLSKVAPREKSKLGYEYDFGDSWEHELLVEKILQPEPGARYPRCIAGKRACPPEDCGGIWGYAELLEALADPAHPEHDEQRELVGDELDPEAFDLDEVNQLLRQLR
jgi:hypothetical protein